MIFETLPAAEDYLIKYKFSIIEGVIFPPTPGHVLSTAEDDATHYLIHEWDYCLGDISDPKYDAILKSRKRQKEGKKLSCNYTISDHLKPYKHIKTYNCSVRLIKVRGRIVVIPENQQPEFYDSDTNEMHLFANSDTKV